MLTQLAAEIETFDTKDDLLERLCSGLAEYGIPHVVYLVASAENGSPVRFSNLPSLYEKARAEEDPFLGHSCDGYEITEVGIEFLPDHTYLPSASKTFIRKAAELGFRSGFGIPVRRKDSDGYGGFLLGTPLGRHRFKQKLGHLSEQLRLVCLLAHRRVEELEENGRPNGQSTANIESLSARELEVIQHIANGLSRKECAEKCGLSPFTVAEYTKNAYRKLGVKNRVEATRILLGD